MVTTMSSVVCVRETSGTVSAHSRPASRTVGVSDHRYLDKGKCGADIHFTLHAKEVVKWQITKS